MSDLDKREEWFWLVSKVKELNPDIILEIGIFEGASLKLWEQIAKSLVIGIDINTENITWDWRKSNKVQLITGSSYKSIKEAKEILQERKLDFLFIDGDHEYQACYFDFLNYMPLVRSGGIVGFHDIHRLGPGRMFDSLGGNKQKCPASPPLYIQKTGIWWKP